MKTEKEVTEDFLSGKTTSEQWSKAFGEEELDFCEYQTPSKVSAHKESKRKQTVQNQVQELYSIEETKQRESSDARDELSDLENVMRSTE